MQNNNAAIFVVRRIPFLANCTISHYRTDALLPHWLHLFDSAGVFSTVYFRKSGGALCAPHQLHLFNFSPLCVSEAHCALHISWRALQLGARLFHRKMNTYLAQTIFQENYTFQICSFSARLIVTIYIKTYLVRNSVKHRSALQLIQLLAKQRTPESRCYTFFSYWSEQRSEMNG